MRLVLCDRDLRWHHVLMWGMGGFGACYAVVGAALCGVAAAGICMWDFVLACGGGGVSRDVAGVAPCCVGVASQRA